MACPEPRAELNLAAAMRLKALKINRILGSATGMADNYDHLGQIYLRQGDLTNAEAMFASALALERSRGEGHPGQAADLCVRLGHIYWVRKEPAQARQLFAEALAGYARQDRRKDQAACLVCLGLLARQCDDLEQAESRLAGALDVLERMDDPETSALVYAELGMIYLLHPDGAAAQKVLTEAQRLFRSLADDHGLGHVCGHLGLAAMLQDRFKEAHAYLLEAIQINRRLGRPGHLADNLANLGSLYWSMAKPHRAAHVYRKALALFERCADRAKIEKTRNLLTDLVSLHGIREALL